MAALIQYIKVGVRYLFSGKKCMPDRKEAVLSPPDNESGNLYVIEILYDGVEDMSASIFRGHHTNYFLTRVVQSY
jgi:hypothetical protein